MSNKGKKGSSSNRRGVIRLSPSSIYFTHSRIRPQFTGCNKVIADTLLEIVDGVTRIVDIPLITVIENQGCFFSLNNRRLYLFKQLEDMGLIPSEGIECYIKVALDREAAKYTPERCSLRGRLMGGKSAEQRGEEGKSDDEQQPVEVSGDKEE